MRGIFLSLLFLTAQVATCQLTDASLSGTASDPQAAMVPGALITAVNDATGVRYTAQTNSSGFYSIRPLPIGLYTVTAELSGFQKQTRTGLRLTTGDRIEMNFVLEIGSTAESVTVTANQSILETRTSDASQLVESKTIEDMPLGDRRAMNLIEITGAAVFIEYESNSKPNYSLAGGRAQSQMDYIDGGTGQNMRIGVGQMDIDPPVESLAEVKIMVNGFSAEFGGSASGGVLATTKSGTNRIRGSLFHYFRNEKLDAPNYFSPIVDGKKTRPSLRYNVFGGTIGGPIKRDKLFYFLSYEGSRRRDGSVRTLTVPSLLQRDGDFSQTFTARGLAVIYDPFSAEGELGTTRKPFPGNVIPKARQDAVGQRIIPFFPLPNRNPDDIAGANNFRANDVNAFDRENIVAKVDYNPTDKDRLTVRYLYNKDQSARASVFPNPAADPTNQTDNFQYYWYGTWTRIVTPNIINEFRTTYGYRKAHTFALGTGNDWPGQLGLSGVADLAFPRINVNQYAALGSTQQDRLQQPIQQYHIVNSTSWIRGTQTLKWGGEYRPSKNYEVFRPSVSGAYTFSRGLSGLPGNTTTGNGTATLLLGIPSAFSALDTGIIERVTTYWAAFVHSDWTVRPGLTMNLGLRWEIDTPFRDTNNRINGFDGETINPVSGTPGVVKFAGVNGWREEQFNGDYNNFGPRFGFAWRVPRSKRMVLRGAYGIFFAHPFDRAVANALTLGFGRQAALNILDNVAPIPYTLAGGLPIPELKEEKLDDSYGAVRVGQAATRTVQFLEEDRKAGYSQQFNLGLQTELPGRVLLDVSYLGNLSRKLASAPLSLNQIHPSIVAQGLTGQRNRPYPQFSNVQILAPSLGVSAYHAGLLRVEMRFSKGLNVLATYTWSKFLDNSDSGSGGSLGDEGSPYSNFYDRRPDWGPSENDIRHRLTWSSVYQLPFGKGRRFLSRHPLRAVVGGWTVSAVAVLQTAPPITVTTQTNTTFANSAGAQRADVLRNPNLPGDERTIFHWFDTDAFAQPGQYLFGNGGVGIVRADTRTTLNCSLIRTFQVLEGKQLQFRGEVFNAPNHPDFGLPGRVFQGPGFGIVNSARPGRQIQLGLRLTY